MTYHNLPQFRSLRRSVGVIARATVAALLLTVVLNAKAAAAEDDKKADDEEIIKLSPFSVKDDAYKGYVAKSTLIGGKTGQRIVDVAQTVNVITRDLIDDMEIDTPGDALSRIAPGVTSVSSEASSAAGAYIRGFRAQNWSVDGATMRSLSMITNFNTDAIEVIKGPASVTFGAFAAYGGYVSILPKYAHRNQKNQVSVGVGTDSYFSTMVDVGGMMTENGNLQYRLVLGVLDADRAGWEYDYAKIMMVAPSFSYDFSPTTRIRWRVERAHSDVKYGTTAMDVNGKVVKNFSISGPASPRDHVNVEANLSSQMVIETQLNDEWSLKLNLFAAKDHKDWDVNGLIGSGAAQNYLLNASQRRYWWKNFYVDFSTAYKNEEIGNSGISYQAVASLSMDHWDNRYWLSDGNLIEPYRYYRIDPTNPDWSLLPTENHKYPTRYIYYNVEWLGGAVLENVVGLFDDKVLLSAAVRFNYDNRSSHTAWRTPQNQQPGGVYVGNPTAVNINEKITKRFGIVYKPIDNMSFYAGSTEAFLAVGAIFKFDGSRLDPETGKNEEVGFKLDFLEALGGNFSFTGALFRVNVVNKWRGDPNPAHTGFFIQDGAQENQGVDFQVSYTSQKLSAIFGYYKGDGPIDKLSGLRAVVVPDLTYNLWLKYNVSDRLSVGGGFKHVGDTLASNRLFTTDPYTTADLFATYTMPFAKGTMRYRVGVSNATDDDAVMIISNAASVQREDGRRAKLSATYTW